MKSNISSTAIIHDNVIIEEGVSIGDYAIVYPNAIIKKNTFIGPYCIIGEPQMSYYKNDNHKFCKTVIGANCIIRSNTIIYEGVSISDNVQTGHHVTIRENTEIGNNCSIGTLTDIQKGCVLKEYTRVHSGVFMGEYTKIGNYVWVMPHVRFTNDKYPPLDNIKPVTVEDYAVISAGSIILPGITLGSNSIVGAGSIVTKDVLNEKIVYGTPATEKGNIKDIKDENNNRVYPWKDYLKDDRGYPWQKNNKIE